MKRKVVDVGDLPIHLKTYILSFFELEFCDCPMFVGGILIRHCGEQIHKRRLELGDLFGVYGFYPRCAVFLWKTGAFHVIKNLQEKDEEDVLNRMREDHKYLLELEKKCRTLKIYVGYFVQHTKHIEREFNSRFVFESSEIAKRVEYRNGVVLLQRSNYDKKYLKYRSITCIPKYE